MKRFILSAIALTSIAAAAVPASAAPWMSINQRQATLDQRIDQGIRSGRLTRLEASRLRGKFHDLQVMEARFRRSGGVLTMQERRELDQRMAQISNRVTAQTHDAQRR